MARKRPQQKPGAAPDAPSTSLSTPSEEQPQEAAAAISGSSSSRATGSSVNADAAVHRRRVSNKRGMEPAPPSERSPLLNEASRRDAADDLDSDPTTTMAWSRRNQWIIFAVASGACAALNGAMAKLTTTELTTTLSLNIARLLGLSTAEGAVEFIVRATFFGLNLAFNGVMWTLFTQALSRGHSTTQVSIMNTSSNFVLTALLGLVIFSESLPPLWWLGASMLVAGNVIIGRKDEGSKDQDDAVEAASDDAEADAISEAESGRGDYEPVPQADGAAEPVEKDDDDDDDDVPQLGDLGRQR